MYLLRVDVNVNFKLHEYILQLDRSSYTTQLIFWWNYYIELSAILQNLPLNWDRMMFVELKTSQFIKKNFSKSHNFI